MKISVLVPTLGTRKAEFERLLNSLKEQTYKDFEVIVVSQDNHSIIENMIRTFDSLSIRQIKLDVKGLSRARNAGLDAVDGDIVVLSDDDCWYPTTGLNDIVSVFEKEPEVKAVLTQILDKDNETLYKNYPKIKSYIRSKLQLMSKSSIEIAYRKAAMKEKYFDERLGLGADFVCGEEVDFLLRNYEKNKYIYVPLVTVYHPKKNNPSTDKQIVAKGALYGKNFNVLICIMVLIRDLLLKKENNFKMFFWGYNEYIKRKN